MSPGVVRSLVRAWTVGVLAVLVLPGAAALWERLDRRPAWVTAVFVHASSLSAPESRRAEEVATAAALLRLARTGIDTVEPRAARESRAGPGSIYEIDRTIVVRAGTEAQLLRAGRELDRIDRVSSAMPRRALRLSDAAFGFLLLALLFGWATLEPSGLSDADPFTHRPSTVVLNLLALGLVAAAVAVAGLQGARVVLAAFVLLALVPPGFWLVRTRAAWQAAPLRARWNGTVLLAGLVAAAWLVRLAMPDSA